MNASGVPAVVADRIVAAVGALTDEVVDFTQELVRIPTVNPPGENYDRITALLTRELLTIASACGASTRPDRITACVR